MILVGRGGLLKHEGHVILIKVDLVVKQELLLGAAALCLQAFSRWNQAQLLRRALGRQLIRQLCAWSLQFSDVKLAHISHSLISFLDALVRMRCKVET